MYFNPYESIYSTSLNKQALFYLHETLLEQGSGHFNEDALSIGSDIFTVCDGATSIGHDKSSLQPCGGKFAAELTARVFSENNGSLVDLAARANDKIRRAMAKTSIDMSRKEMYWATSFASVRLRADHIEWAQTGDCAIILIYRDGSPQLVTKLPGQDRATLRRWKELGPRVTGTIHEEMAEEIASVRQGMNHDYGVLNGEKAALDFLGSGRVQIKQVSTILLLSDGLFLPSESPEADLDIKTLTKIYLRSGLRGLRDRIRDQQKTDPRCHRYPRFKLHDDMSGIALRRILDT